MNSDLWPLVGLGVQFLVSVILIALAAWGEHWSREESEDLHAKLMRAWRKVETLERDLKVMEARREQDLDAYKRRVTRWQRYAEDVVSFALQAGMLAPWKADAVRREKPADTGYSALDETPPG